MAEVSVKLRVSVKTPATITSPVSWFLIDMLVGVELFTLHVSPKGENSFTSCLWFAWNTVMLGISEIKTCQICIKNQNYPQEKTFLLHLWNIYISPVIFYYAPKHVKVFKMSRGMKLDFFCLSHTNPRASLEFFNCISTTNTFIKMQS